MNDTEARQKNRDCAEKNARHETKIWVFLNNTVVGRCIRESHEQVSHVQVMMAWQSLIRNTLAKEAWFVSEQGKLKSRGGVDLLQRGKMTPFPAKLLANELGRSVLEVDCKPKSLEWE